MSLSFGFKKKIETKVDKSKVIIEKADEVQKEALDEVNEDILNKKSTNKELIVPLIKKNKWYLSSTKQNKDVNQDEDVKLQEKAAKEIMKESAAFLEKSISDDNEFENLAVPLLLKNKVPDGFETDDKLNVDIRPDEASQADYDAVPIEAFGMAVLRGMGWDPKVGIGKTFKKNVKTLEANVRPKGLGLGAAAPSFDEKKHQKSHSSKEEAALEIKVGAYIKVKGGSHKKKYGVIEGMDPDNALCVVKFALGGKTAPIGEFNLEVVAKSEYVKYGKDLSRLTKAHEESERQKELKNGHDRDAGNAQEMEDRSYHKSKKRHASPLRTHTDYDSANKSSYSEGYSSRDYKKKRRQSSPDSREHRDHGLPREYDHKQNKHKKTKQRRSETPEYFEKKKKSHKEKHRKSKKEHKSKKEKRHKYKNDSSSSSY